MKALQKQIKLTNIGKYIKKNDMKWLLFLILPLFLGLILHFLIPITFVLNGNPSAQSTYNHEKITLQQQTVRSLSLLNSQIIRMKLQRYENIRNFLIRIFGQTNPYQRIIPTQIVLNNAYQIAHMVQNGTDISNISSSSMWYATGKSSFNELNPVQQYVYLQYLSVEPFVQTQFLNINNSTQQSILKGLTLSANYLGQPFYFAFPSSFKQQFLSLNTSCFDKYYNQTMYNYFNSNQSYQYAIFSEIIDNENQIVICNLIFSQGSPVGVSCFYILLTDIALQLTKNLGIPNISYSTTSYYLLTPIYPSFTLQSMKYQPQIIFNFTDKTSQNINYPLNTFFDLPQSMDQSLYIPTSGQHSQNYSFFITFDAGRTIYFQVPINVFSYLQTQQTILFLLIKYNFEGSVFNSIAKFSQILKDLSIPSSIVIVVSTLISLIILKGLLNSLDDELHKVNDKCEFLLHGDLDLKIPQYENTEELKPVYQHLKIVNSLHKFSTPIYFNEPPQKQLIKLFKVLETFKVLQYPIDIVLENIADSYLMMGQLFKAIEFLTQSYDILIKEVQQIFQQSLNDILKLKHKENKKLSKKYRKYQLKIIARLFKLILMYSFLLIPPPQITFDKSRYTSDFNRNKLPPNIFQNSQKKIRKYLQIFKKLAYPTFVTSQTVFAYLFEARFQIQKKNFKAAKTILKRIQRIMTDYGNDFQNVETNIKDDSPIKTYQQMKNNLSSYCKVSPSILWSAYYFIQGLFLSEQSLQSQVITEIVGFFKKSVEGVTFAEDIHLRVLSQMIKLSFQYQIDEKIIRSLFSSLSFFKQIYPLYHIQTHHNSLEGSRLQLLSRIQKGLQREVIFMFDCSNKWINQLQQFRKWQKQCRQVSSKIFNYLEPDDRVSILKVNSSVYVSTCCNLIYKKGNQSLIIKQLGNAIKLKFMAGKCRIVQGLKTAVNRIKILEEEKYILVFVKENKEPLLTPRGNQPEKKVKKMSQSSSNLFRGIKVHNFNGLKKARKNTEISPYHKETVHSKAESNLNSLQQDQQFEDLNSNQFFQYYKYIREEVLALLLTPQVFNLKIILITPNAQNFKQKFNLHEVNAILEKEFIQRPVYNNNSLLVLEYQDQDEFQRIFKKKTVQRDSQTILSMF